MDLSRPATTLIPRRSSCRSFQDVPLPSDARARLEAAIGAAEPGPFGGRLRAVLIEDRRMLAQRHVGTYGMIRGAATYLVPAIGKGPRAMEDFGYLVERLILTATDLGLGTCWLGGTFDRGRFSDLVARRPDEVVPAVTPVGVPAARRSIVDRVTRLTAGSDRRKPWAELFFDGAFGAPLSEAAAGAWATPLEMLRLAPSASNRQPWRVVRRRDALHLYVTRTPLYDRMTPGVDLQRIDLGIAMSHLEFTAQELGLSGGWRDEDPGITSPARTEYVVTWGA